MPRKKYKAPPFVMLRRDLLNDLQWKKLSNSAKIIYIYLRMKFNHKKVINEVSLSYRETKDLMSSKTISKAFKELIKQKWIEKTKHGGLYGGVCLYKFVGQYKDFFYRGYKV